MEKLAKIIQGASSVIRGARQIFPKSPKKALEESKKAVNLTDKGQVDSLEVTGNVAAWVGFAIVFGKGLLELVKVKWPETHEAIIQLLGGLAG